ncbi:hypothetical protein Btus_2905 [Kyrpidia tusciae DSM 2912]|uniref:Uncharacterized protein n=1 Tax=Kyrpidia tusciae (strain DSM 2912 / NBRC 15312 / T2) TaxID=562970 RepID=D5WVJ9_KYRT2|nr:hypothetical protein Btus_2905 [Kyrpidia tusciae DSM 2912]
MIVIVMAANVLELISKTSYLQSQQAVPCHLVFIKIART